MRHLRSVLYALVLAPAVWALCAAGLTRDPGAFALLPLVLAGAAYAILLFAPISPAGPALSGLLFFGVGGWALIAPSSYGSVFPGGGFDLSTPGYALATLLAIPLMCTALSARRWAAYEPPQIPLLGTIGRPRARAAAPGTPIATQPTEPIPTSPAANGDEPTTFFPAQPNPAAQPHSAAFSPTPPPGATSFSSAPTEPVATASPEPSTVPRPFLNRPGTAPTAEEPTTAVVDSDEPTEPVTEAGEPTTPITGEEPTQPARIFVTHSDGVSEEFPADEITASHQPTESISEPPAEPEPDKSDDDQPTVVPAALADEKDGEKTTVIRRGLDREVGAGPTRDFRGGGKTYLDGPGEQTQVIYLLEPTNAEHAAQQAAKARAAEQAARDHAAQEKARQAFRDRAAQERARQAFADRAAAEARSVGEETQIIKLPVRDDQTTRLPDPSDQTTRLPSVDDQTTRLPSTPAATSSEKTADEGEKTTVLPPAGKNASEGDGEETTLLRHATVMAEPVDGVAGESRSRSIVEQERPDPAADPTTRLIPAQREPEPEPRDRGLVDSLMDLERPADER